MALRRSRQRGWRSAPTRPLMHAEMSVLQRVDHAGTGLSGTWSSGVTEEFRRGAAQWS